MEYKTGQSALPGVTPESIGLEAGLDPRKSTCIE